ncbi:sulfotransferase 1C2-like [Tropilaelaps mercedesae]|uniref:Sulfotransferase 1C2-like n=1 Tax=Tropilaelaps mercedesae TaxID=418985 RepID=A0A1V9XR94_9ACAR|nr:sulfotransferase 1C2-like [Tropilaelaps mercedesae]
MAASVNQTGVDVPSSLRPLYYDMDGFRLSAAFNIDRFRSAVNYKPVKEDIFIATYPKCGTTWLQEICYLILNDGQEPPSLAQWMTDMPFLELLGGDFVKHMRRPGAIKTHLPFNLVPYSPHAKYIYVVRNPKDCLISFYWHTTKVYPGYNFTDGTFDEFFELFIAGKTDFGSYFDHVRSFLRQRHQPNLHIIFFEDVKTNGPEEILKLGRFLGKPYEEKLKAGLLEKVIEQSSVKKMRETFKEFKIDYDIDELPEGMRQFAMCNATAVSVFEIKDHIRKGSVNDWKNYLTADQNRRLEALMLSTLAEEFPELISQWRKHGVFDALPIKSPP